MIRLLENHPFIEVVKVSASPAKVGRKYGEVVPWILSGEVPEYARDLPIVSTEPNEHKDVDVVLSALPNEVAAQVEPKLLEAGINVISNAAPERLNPRIPLINPEVNWEHLEVLREWKGAWLVKNPNCTTAIISLALKPIQDLIDGLDIVTLQSVSGAGFLGISFLVIHDNVIPYIKGEEEKIEAELKKMFGRQRLDGYEAWECPIRTTATRVPVKYGHMGVLHIGLKSEVEYSSIIERLRSFKSLPQEKGLPTAPREPIKLISRIDGPQPMRDLDPMAVSVGRITVKGRWLRMVVLGHNLVRGAAGISILTLETMRALGLV